MQCATAYSFLYELRECDKARNGLADNQSPSSINDMGSRYGSYRGDPTF